MRGRPVPAMPFRDHLPLDEADYLANALDTLGLRKVMDRHDEFNLSRMQVLAFAARNGAVYGERVLPRPALHYQALGLAPEPERSRGLSR